MFSLYPVFVLFISLQLTKCAPAESNLDDILDTVGQQITFQLEDPVHPFIGRTTELSSIKWFHADKKLVTITGERGIGKTELARKYAYNYKIENSGDVIWINTNSITQMVADFKNIHSKYIGDISDKKITAIIRAVFDHFKTRKALFIFDAAQKDNVLLKQLKTYIGDSQTNNVIITSRDDDWDTTFYTNLKLEVFTKGDSVAYIKIALKDLDIPTDESKAEELALALKYLPLALNKSSDYIIKQNKEGKKYTIDDFLRQLSGNELSTTQATQVVIIEDEAVEEDLISKITEESAKVGSKIATGATQAWEKVSDGASYVGSQVSHGAQQAGKEISHVAQNVGSSVKKFFSGFG